MNIYDKIKDLKFADWEDLFDKHLEWSKANDRVAGNPRFPKEPGTIIQFGIRCNDERNGDYLNIDIDFNNGKYNDYLITVLNVDDKSCRIIITEATCDPAKIYNGAGNPIGRAHLCQGVYNSYKLRAHNYQNANFPEIGNQPRASICQDKDKVKVVRTDGKGKEVDPKKYSPWGMHTINIHPGPTDSSLGCSMWKSTLAYVQLVFPILYSTKTKKYLPANKDDITYVLINQKNLEKYLDETVPAQATNGEGFRYIGEAKNAKKI